MSKWLYLTVVPTYRKIKRKHKPLKPPWPQHEQLSFNCIKRHSARDVQVQVITVFKNWTCFKHIWATALSWNCWTRTSAPGAWAPRPPSAPVTAMMLAPFVLGKSNCGIETKLYKMNWDLRYKKKNETYYVLHHHSDVGNVGSNSQDCGVRFWSSKFQSWKWKTESQIIQVHAVILFNLTVPEEFLELLASNLKILFTWSWVLGLHPSSPEPAILSDQLQRRQHRQKKICIENLWKPWENSIHSGVPAIRRQMAGSQPWDRTGPHCELCGFDRVSYVRTCRTFFLAGKKPRKSVANFTFFISSFPAGGVWIGNYSIYWCNAYHILPTGYCINYCIYQQLRSKDFLRSLLNYARFVYHTTRFMIWGVYSARPGRSEQVEDPRYQKHWKASVPSVPSILRNPRDRTSDSGLLWASLRICPKVKLRSFTRHSWIFHRGNRFHRFCRFPFEASLGLRAS